VKAVSNRNGKVEAYFDDHVGPARAEQLLKTYKVDYRKYRETYAEGLGRDMISGHWNFDGSPIRIDEEGNLFDGQHRLNAVIMSGTTQEFLIVTGLPVSAYDTTDTGLARTYGDTLRRRGYTNVSLRAALVKLISRWETGYSLDSTKRLTNSELDAIHDKYVDQISRAAGMAGSVAKKVFVPNAVLALIWWKLRQVAEESGGNAAEADEFMIAVTEGENLSRGMPEYALRNRLINDAEIDHSRMEYAHMFFYAWNSRREGQELHRITLPRGVTTRENMAVPH
jgi:hypothetical protein